MASDVTPAIERIGERPTKLEPRGIEAEFTRIWRETAGDDYDRSSVRLRMFNFVALADDPSVESKFDDVMQMLVQRHPCRGILAITGTQFRQLEASISARCWRMAGGGRHVCSEEVFITGPVEEDAVASAVLGLLVPELPVTVWLAGSADLARQFDAGIIESADRVFFDTGTPDAQAQSLRAAAGAARDGLELCDLAWCRLATWRTLCAQFFDGDDGLRQLPQITSIDIAGGGDDPSAEALLLAGWLISRLGFTLADVTASAGRVVATCYARSRGVTVTARGDSSAVSPVAAISIKTIEAEFAARLHPESRHIHVGERWDADPVRRTVESLPLDDASVIALALDDYADPMVYGDAVRAALALLGA